MALSRRREALLLLAVGVAAGATWWSAAQGRLDAVLVSAPLDGVRCSLDGAVPVEDAVGVPARSVTLLPAAPGLTCTVRVDVLNRGADAVRLDGLVVPLGGPASRAGLRLTGTSTGRLAPAEPDVDARVVLDRALLPGERQEVVLTFAFNPDGCHGPATARYLAPEAPSAEVSALGRSGTAGPGGAAYAIAPWPGGRCD